MKLSSFGSFVVRNKGHGSEETRRPASGACGSNDRMSHLGRNPFADDDCCDDDQQNERHLGPGERGDRGVEGQADAAGANEVIE